MVERGDFQAPLPVEGFDPPQQENYTPEEDASSMLSSSLTISLLRHGPLAVRRSFATLRAVPSLVGSRPIFLCSLQVVECQLNKFCEIQPILRKKLIYERIQQQAKP